jgi:hypothetical protein
MLVSVAQHLDFARRNGRRQMKLTVLFIVVVGANSGLVVEKREAQAQGLIDLILAAS